MNPVDQLIDSYVDDGMTEEEAMRKVARQLDEGRDISSGFDYFHHNANLRPETDTPEKPSPDAWLHHDSTGYRFANVAEIDVEDAKALFSAATILKLVDEQIQAFDEDIEFYDEPDKFRHKKEAMRQFKGRLKEVFEQS